MYYKYIECFILGNDVEKLLLLSIRLELSQGPTPDSYH